MHAASLIARHLECQGVERVFCVPGESYLDLLDALRDSRVDVITCRHEGGAAMMAQADGAMTGRPGVALVTRGPGVCNALSGLHVARQGGTPLVLLVGQVATADRGRDAFQEVDYRRFFGDVVKRVEEVDDTSRLSEQLMRAWFHALAERAGPVVLAVPEDRFADSVSEAPSLRVETVVPHPSDEQMVAVLDRIVAAKRPLVVAGGAYWSPAARDALLDFATRFELPIAVGFRRQNLVPAEHPCAAGHLGLVADPTLVEAARSSDLLLLLGSRFGDITSQGHTIEPIPGAGERVVHVHADPNEHGRLYRPSISVLSTPEAFLDAALRRTEGGRETPKSTRRRHRERLVVAARAWSDPPAPPRTAEGWLHPLSIVCITNAMLPRETVLTSGAGNYATWFHRYGRWPIGPTQLAPVSGSMGYGLPAAIAAKLRWPERPVVALAGDGCFTMTAQEFATAVQFDVSVVVLVLDNRQYGTIRMHQERRFPGRPSATALSGIDFAALAVALGGRGILARDAATLEAALDRALTEPRPTLIHCPIDPQVLSPTMTLSDTGARPDGHRGESPGASDASLRPDTVPRTGSTCNLFTR